MKLLAPPKCACCPRKCGSEAIEFRGFMLHSVVCWLRFSRGYFRWLYGVRE